MTMLKRLNAIKSIIDKYEDDELYSLESKLFRAYNNNNKKEFDNIEHDIKVYIEEVI